MLSPVAVFSSPKPVHRTSLKPSRSRLYFLNSLVTSDKVFAGVALGFRREVPGELIRFGGSFRLCPPVIPEFQLRKLSSDEFVNPLFGFRNQILLRGAGISRTPNRQPGGPVTTI